MNQQKYAKGEQGVIKDVFYGKEDHGLLTCMVRIEFKTGTQGFGGLAFENEAIGQDFTNDLMAAFRVSSLAALEGKSCTALWTFGHNNEFIEALVAPNGQHLTITDWRRKHYPDTPDPHQRRLTSLEDTRTRLRVQMKEVEHDIRELRATISARNPA